MEAQFGGINCKVTHEMLAGELAIIMSDDDTHAAWQKAILLHEKGKLINPDTGNTFFDDHNDIEKKKKEKHEASKSTKTFITTNYSARPLSRETFKALAGMTSYDLHTAARRLTEIGPSGFPRVCFRKPKLNHKVINLPTWTTKRKWKNTLITELQLRTKDYQFWTGEEGHQVLNREVWLKFKKQMKVTKAKWTTLFEVATHDWLNKKRVANNKALPSTEGLRRMLDMWLKKEAQTEPGNVINMFAKRNNDGSLNTTRQLEDDKTFLGTFAVAAGFVDFRFFPGSEDRGRVRDATVDYLVRYINNPDWFPGLSLVPVWMLIADPQNADAALNFMRQLSERHPDTYLTVPALYVPCVAEDIPEDPELSKWRDLPSLHVFFFVNKKKPQKKLPSVFLPPDLPRYTVHKGEWSELGYELYRGELRMQAYLSFLAGRCLNGNIIVNFFGGLKPSTVALVSSYRSTETIFLEVSTFYCFCVH